MPDFVHFRASHLLSIRVVLRQSKNSNFTFTVTTMLKILPNNNAKDSTKLYSQFHSKATKRTNTARLKTA